jgi:hypothetical protein
MPSVFPLIAGVGTMRLSETGLPASAEDASSLANLETIVTAAHVPLRFVVSNPDVARYLRTFAAADPSLRLKVVQIGGL